MNYLLTLLILIVSLNALAEDKINTHSLATVFKTFTPKSSMGDLANPNQWHNWERENFPAVNEINDQQDFGAHCMVFHRADETLSKKDVNNFTNPIGDAVMISNTKTIYMTTHEITGYIKIDGTKWLKKFHATLDKNEEEKADDLIAVQCGNNKKFLAQVVRYTEGHLPENYNPMLHKDSVLLKPYLLEDQAIANEINPFEILGGLTSIEKLKELDKEGFVVQGHCFFKGADVTKICRTQAICHISKLYKNDQLLEEDFQNGNGNIGLTCTDKDGKAVTTREISGSPIYPINKILPNGEVELKGNSSTNQAYVIGLLNSGDEIHGDVGVELFPQGKDGGGFYNE